MKRQDGRIFETDRKVDALISDTRVDEPDSESGDIETFIQQWLTCAESEHAILSWERTGAHGCFDNLSIRVGRDIQMRASSSPWTVPPTKRYCSVDIRGTWAPISSHQWDRLCAPFTPSKTELVNNWWGGFNGKYKLTS